MLGLSKFRSSSIIRAVLFISSTFIGILLCKILLTSTSPLVSQRTNSTYLNFIISPRNQCGPVNGRKEKFIINLVHSGRGNYRSRQIIRETYGAIKSYKNWTTQVIFVLGVGQTYEDPEVQEMLESETKDFMDIIVGNFLDTYQNLSYKHLIGHKWAAQYCDNASYYLKSNDNMIVDIFHVIEFLEAEESKRNFYYCHSSHDSGNISYVEYPWKSYPEPDHCDQGAYLTSVENVKMIYSVNNQTSYLTKDDVWMTGILREYLEENLNYKTDFIQGGVLDYGYVYWDYTNSKLTKLEKKWIAVRVEIMVPYMVCRLWRRIHEIHGKNPTLKQMIDCDYL